MTTISKSAEINATRDTIRKYYAHPVHTPQWSTAMTLWEPDAAWPTTGATAKMGFSTGGIKTEGIATTLAYDDATMTHHFKFESSNMDPMEFWFTFDEHDSVTTVTQKITYTIPGSIFGKVLDKLYVERQNSKDVEQGLRNLKAMAEGSA